MSLACLAHVNFLLHMYFDLITEQINDDDDDDVIVTFNVNTVTNTPRKQKYTFVYTLLPRDATQKAAESGDAMASRLSVCLYVTMRYDYHIGLGWNTSKIISRLISLRSSVSPDTNFMSLHQR